MSSESGLQPISGDELVTLLKTPGSTASSDGKIDLTRFDLSGICLEKVEFKNCIFSRAKLPRRRHIEHTEFRNCTFLACSFCEIDLLDIAFRGSIFVHCDFRLALFRDNTFTEAILERCDLYRSRFEGNTVFERARLIDCSLHLASFAGADLRRENVENAVVQESKEAYDAFLIGCFGKLTKDQSTRYVALRQQEAAGIYRSLSGLWSAKAYLGDATWAYVRARRLETKLMRPPFSWHAPVLSTAPSRPELGLTRNMRGITTILPARGGAAPLPGKLKQAGNVLRQFPSYLAALTSDLVCAYGSSLLRVFVWLVLSGFAFAAVYDLVSALEHANASSFERVAFERATPWQCVNFSFHRLVGASPAQIRILERFEPIAAFETCVGFILLGLFGFVFGNRVRNA